MPSFKMAHILAVALVIAVGAWMLSGTVVISGSGGDTRATDNAISGLDTPVPVRVRLFEAEERTQLLAVRGRTEPERRVRVAAETRDQLIERRVDEGDRVSEGDLLCVLETGARRANLAQAEASLAQAELDFSAAERLGERGFAAETRIRALQAARDAAAALLEQARLELERVEIHAPVAGVVEAPLAEVGSFLSAGDPCVTLIDLDPLLVTGQVSERQIAGLSIGMDAEVTLVDGGEHTGTIRFIAAAADMATRTFRVEIAIPNPGYRLRAGVTASAAIALAPVPGHRIPASALVLADDGTVGVRAVGDDERAVFLPVTITGDDGEGFWVTGLPQSVEIIVVGEHFVIEGQKLTPIRVETLTQEPAAS
ncbi:MAG: efflux RND transporter periplasmic adaptor subunit [Hyphomicrobiaceae bacterium]|nr:efflux RND transporter periplasmic adaptor subunit [Hyphomicrobiaceae bacterium]